MQVGCGLHRMSLRRSLAGCWVRTYYMNSRAIGFSLRAGKKGPMQQDAGRQAMRRVKGVDVQAGMDQQGGSSAWQAYIARVAWPRRRHFPGRVAGRPGRLAVISRGGVIPTAAVPTPTTPTPTPANVKHRTSTSISTSSRPAR